MHEEAVTMFPMIVSGGSDMVKADVWHEIHSRFKLKESRKSIARSVGLSVQTVRRILRQREPQPYRSRPTVQTIMAPYAEYVQRRLAAVGYCAQSIFEELRGHGFTGCYETVKKYIRPFRDEAQAEATVRFETPPGKQGQVDWGQCWTILGGRRCKVHLFVMTLGYSRRMFSKVTDNEKMPAFITCHEESFDHFGGMPHELVYDNSKAVVLSRDFEGRDIRWNQTFWDFSRYYGFRPWAHRPYRPQTKGKVESGIKYVKRFLRGKSFESLDHMNERLLQWIETVADQRIHGTTHRKPIDTFAEERDLLMSHQGKPPYAVQERAVRQVAKDCMVTFQTNRYSVPFLYAGRPVEVQSIDDRVMIYHDSRLLVSHPRCDGTFQSRIVGEHYKGIDRRTVSSMTAMSSHLTTALHEVEVRDLAFYEGLLQGGAL